MMRLSEAIRLGSLTTKPIAGALHKTIGGIEHGCAIGMAENALSIRSKHPNIMEVNSPIFVAYPWLQKYTSWPCGCVKSTADISSTYSVIFHLFDNHVRKEKDWSLDQLCDWVESVETAFTGTSLSTEPSAQKPIVVDAPPVEEPVNVG